MSFECGATHATEPRTPYESGRLTPGDQSIFRPGGLDLTARAMGLAKVAAGARVVDLGCGAGNTIRWLRAQGFEAIGIDCTPTPESRIVARAEALPLPDSSVDAIFAECSLSLFESPALAIAECSRVLVDGGQLIISDLYARNPDAIAQVRAFRGSCASGMLVREELEAILARADFAVNVREDYSRALRECAARFLFEHGSLDGLWGCSGESSAGLQAAMRAARAGYFLLIAARRDRTDGKGKL